MEGTQLWTRVRQGLDQISFKAFEELYLTGTEPSRISDWVELKGLEDILEESEVVTWDEGAGGGEEVVAHEVPQPDDDVEDMDSETIKTICIAMGVKMLGFGMPGEVSNPLLSYYKQHITVRVDPENDFLIYDVFEAHPMFYASHAWPLDDKNTLKLSRTFHTNPGEGSDLEDDVLEPEIDEQMTHYFMTLFSNFRESRILRTRIDLNDVSSLTLHQPKQQYKPSDVVEQLLKGKWCRGEVLEHKGPFIKLKSEGEERMALPQHIRKPGEIGVLTLELNDPTESFATRAVYSSTIEYNRLDLTGDWSPDCTATESLRHYIVAPMEELHHIATHIFKSSPHLKTSTPPSSILPSSSPPLVLPHPSKRRAPMWGCEGWEGVTGVSSERVKAGRVNLLDEMAKRAKLEEEEREMKAVTGVLEDPDFQFPKTMEVQDEVLAKARAWIEGMPPPPEDDSKNKEIEEEKEEQKQQKPEPVPVVAELRPSATSRGLSSSSWSCGACDKGGLLAWVKRCPGCGIALAPKRRPAPKMIQKPDEPVPESWEDGQ